MPESLTDRQERVSEILNLVGYGLANVVKLYIQDLNTGVTITTEKISPSMKSKFKQLQETGKEAEFYFMSNYKNVDRFADGILEDARLWGYGYPYLTIWGIADEESIPTTEGLHGLLNFENYDERICNKDFRIVQCS